MIVDSMGASLTKGLMRKNAKAVLMSIKMADGVGGDGGGGIWKVSTHDDPAVALEKERERQNILHQERTRQEAERELREAEREAEREANLPAYLKARRAGRGRMLIARTPDPWTRPKPAGYGFTVGIGPKR